MNILQSCIVYFCLCVTVSSACRSGCSESDTRLVPTTPKNKNTANPIHKLDDKYIRFLIQKMLKVIRTWNQNKLNNTSGKVHNNKTKENKNTLLHVKHVVAKNKRKTEDKGRAALKRQCPYFVPNGGFNIEKLESVYWPRFHNMNESLECFKIYVKKLTEEQMEENENTYGTFKGRVNWKQCRFEVKSLVASSRRHFLLGDVTDMGVMRNMLVTADSNDNYSLQEDSPDQWVMINNQVILRDCRTGEVVVFSKCPQTTTEEVVAVLDELGEEMTGEMVCEENEDRLAV